MNFVMKNVQKPSKCVLFQDIFGENVTVERNFC